MRRALLVPVALLLAFLASSIVLLAGAAVLWAEVPLQTSLAMLDAVAWVFAGQPGSGPDPFGAGIGVAIWRMLVTVGLGPIALVAAFGELTRRRSLLALSCATGLLAVLAPLVWMVGVDTGRAVSLEGSGRVLALLFLSGVASGGTYGLVAGSSGPAGPSRH